MSASKSVDFDLQRRAHVLIFLFIRVTFGCLTGGLHQYLKTDNCLRRIVLVLPTFGAHRKARQISAAERPSQHRIHFDLLSRETYTLRRSLPPLRVFLHNTNKNEVQT